MGLAGILSKGRNYTKSGLSDCNCGHYFGINILA
jgi:hypothetical protein